ncbi:Lrp/AsnC family transcriptional regulator [Reinekea sp.]|jgi:Lrp/AsnC family leucine-responsive transcriptional regulator|uniref:Lrp/AsnC family transcriptional regulator n=1 Tax=Reinekea sp. TaxID=1970455 RepID=UPI002A830862|nr:Lrp/AsnC ligand binding domain-containing protein [Reinekea sp.]
MKNSELDRADRKILKVLAVDGRVSVTDLAKQVGLSKSPCAQRIKRLEGEGYIKGYGAILDHNRLGQAHIAFVEVKLSSTTDASLKAFNRAVIAIAEVEQCHMIAGGFDYLLKIRSKDIEDYRRILGEYISTLPFVGHTSTYVTMETVKD